MTLQLLFLMLIYIQADGSHPSIYGSYLAACVFYNVIFETTPVGNTFLPAGVTQNQATYLQSVAYHVCK